MSRIKRIERGSKAVDDVYEEFILSRKMQNFSPATIKFYFWNLKAFRDYLKDKGIKDVSELSKKEYDSFALFLVDKYQNPTTINTYLRATRAFINFAISEGYIEEFIVRVTKTVKVVKDTYTDEEIRKLLEKPDLKHCSFAQYRDWVIVNYLLETGNRLSTVINIKVKDIDLEGGMVVLKFIKNKKQMFSPLGAAMVKILMNYIREWALEKEDYLFPNYERKMLSKNAIQNSISRYNKSRGVNLTSIHAFRHTFAKRYVTKGGNAFKLKTLLGHSSLKVTENYVSLYGNDLVRDFERFSTVDEFSGKRIKRI